MRSSSAALDAGLRRALRAHVVEGGEAPPNYSVRVADEPGAFHFLFWGGRTVLRTLDPQRLLAALLAHLSGHLDVPPGRLRANAIAAVNGETALVLPAWLRQELAHLEPLLVRRGFTVADGPWVDIDLATAELVVIDPALSVDRPALEAVAADLIRKRREQVVRPGRYPIAAWSFLGPAVEDGHLSRAESTLRAAGLSSTKVTPASLALIGTFFATVPGRSFSEGAPSAIVEHLESLVGGNGGGGSGP